MRWLRRFWRRVPTLDSRAAYDLWAAQYPAQAHNALMQVEQTTMQALLPDMTGQQVLDLACGTGRYGRIARAQGAETVISLDNSPAMLQHGAVPQAALASVMALPLASGSVDVVICGLALGHIPDIDQPLREIGRVLKPGGVALISDFHPFQFLSGARRTFRSEQRTYAVEHHVHLYTDYHRAAHAAGLRLQAIREPGLKEALPPVVLVLRFTL